MKDDCFEKDRTMTQPRSTDLRWTDVAALADLPESGRLVVRPEGRQIALFRVGERVLACNNRCPHEGYPLAEGDLGGEGGCVLTCNWHNWKFDLIGGETLVGGDRLRRYPARIADGRIVLDLSDPPAETRIADALYSLTDSFRTHDYSRMAREIARLGKAGGDPLDALRRTLAETAARFEFGSTHAVPASADWLSLRAEQSADATAALAMLTECVGHFAWDALREPERPFPEGRAPWDADVFVRAVEDEDEALACALVRGAIADGLGWEALEPALAEAALAHYADFGHSAIYTYKMRALTAHLGDRESLERLCLMLARSMVYATREDLIPEFRAYRDALTCWRAGDGPAPDAEELRGLSVRKALARLAEAGAPPEALYDAAMQAASWQMLHFDLAWQDAVAVPVSKSVGWLDFTHALTFGNAARKLCERRPDLWPNAILQLGCFLGRNAPFTDPDLDEAPWRGNDPQGDVEAALAAVRDHGQGEYIVSAHLLKLSYALREEAWERPEAPWHPLAAAALKRFLASPLKRKHTLRTAHQALDFVAAEG
jgi:nitrite reductase/ring-hydroxylating ferredoxin subunit